MLIGRDKNYKNPDKDRECFTVSAQAEDGKDGVTQETCHEVGPWLGTGQNVRNLKFVLCTNDFLFR